MTDRLDWVRGDALGLELPAHPEALRAAGTAFLTRAFRAFGSMSPDNEVVEIAAIEDCVGGSTGRKLCLSLRYARAEPGLHERLFVKFSRDFDDALRDRGRTQMQAEIRFAGLSTHSAFPIAVPACLYADYHATSGTGLLISQCIDFGIDGVEPHRGKCLDEALSRPEDYYAAILQSLAALAGAHRSGRLPAKEWTFDPATQVLGERAPYDAEQVRRRVARYAEFASRYPQLLPENLRAPSFLARLSDEAPRFTAYAVRIEQALSDWSDAIALSHWNANLDNAWFWRDRDGRLHCGLLDWGCAGQMNLAMAIWGALSGADLRVWNAHLDALLQGFVQGYARHGGPVLDIATLRLHLLLHAGQMGLNWLLDVPAWLQKHVPELGTASDRFDLRIRDHEAARTQLHMLCVFLDLWDRHDIGGTLRCLVHDHEAVE